MVHTQIQYTEGTFAITIYCSTNSVHIQYTMSICHCHSVHIHYTFSKNSLLG